MNKYERLKNELASAGTGKMKAFGNSMQPEHQGTVIFHINTP